MALNLYYKYLNKVMAETKKDIKDMNTEQTIKIIIEMYKAENK